MSKINIYRVECKAGFGMYSSNTYNGILHDEDRHPGPYSDSTLRQDMEQRDFAMDDFALFGFRSKRQLKRWLHAHDRRRMHARGFSIKTYEVDRCDAVLGDTQVVFRSERAYKTGQMDLISI